MKSIAVHCTIVISLFNVSHSSPNNVAFHTQKCHMLCGVIHHCLPVHMPKGKHVCIDLIDTCFEIQNPLVDPGGGRRGSFPQPQRRRGKIERFVQIYAALIFIFYGGVPSRTPVLERPLVQPVIRSASSIYRIYCGHHRVPVAGGGWTHPAHYLFGTSAGP